MRQSKQQNSLSIVPLFAGLFVACIAAAGAIGTTIDTPEYELALYLTITAGLLGSLLTRAKNISLSFLGPVVIVGALCAFVIRWADLGWVHLLYPIEAISESNTELAALIAWGMAGLCFMQNRRELLMLCLVSGLAVFGLMAPVSLDTTTLVLFSIYLFGAVYTLGYENLLATYGTDLKQLRGWIRLAWSQLVPTAVLLLVVTLAAAGTGRALYEIAPNIYGKVSPLSWRWAQLNPANYALALGRLWVGGGQAHLSKDVVMTVRSKRPALWRGQVFDTYGGQSWYTQQTAVTPAQYSSDGGYHLVSTDLPPGAPLEQTFTLRRINSPIIYAAARPAVVYLPGLASLDQRQHDVSRQASGAIQVTPYLLAGSSYRVISIVPDFSAQQLRAAGSTYPGQQFVERYIEQIPVSVEGEIAELVGEITAAARTPYDKVAQIRDFLEEEYLYTESSPLTPPGADSTVYFLKISKRGDCRLFSTAMAMMCRLAGVPARVATGYATGEYDAGQGLYLVRGEDAHAWTEVYFPGYGWVPFDVQAPARLKDQTFFSLLSRGHLRLVVGRFLRASAFALSGLAVVALVCGLFVDFGRVTNWWAALRTPSGPWTGLERQWRRFYQRVLRRTGIQPRPGHTPAELLEAALSKGLLPEVVAAGVRRATEDLYELRYSPRPATTSQIDKLRRRWVHLRKRI